MKRLSVFAVLAVGCVAPVAPVAHPPPRTSSPPSEHHTPVIVSPPAPDRDKDGIADSDDKCPDEPETFNGFEDEDGCPDRRFVDIGSPTIVLNRVDFPSGSTAWDAASKPVLEDMASLFKEHPDFSLVQVEGYTDATEAKGEAALKLATARAEAVRKYLVGKGVDPKRLRTKGFGSYCPLVDHDRRVEFKIVRSADGPTGMQLGCAAATAAGIVSAPP